MVSSNYAMKDYLKIHLEYYEKIFTIQRRLCFMELNGLSPEDVSQASKMATYGYLTSLPKLTLIDIDVTNIQLRDLLSLVEDTITVDNAILDYSLLRFVRCRKLVIIINNERWPEIDVQMVIQMVKQCMDNGISVSGNILEIEEFYDTDQNNSD